MAMSNEVRMHQARNDLLRAGIFHFKPANIQITTGSSNCQKSYHKVHKKECAALYNQRRAALSRQEMARQAVEQAHARRQRQQAVETGLLQRQQESGFIREFEEDEQTDAFVRDVSDSNEEDGTRLALRGGGQLDHQHLIGGHRLHFEVEFARRGQNSEHDTSRHSHHREDDGESRMVELEDDELE